MTALPTLTNWEQTSHSLHKAAMLLGAIRQLLRPRQANYLELALRIEPTGLSTDVLPTGGNVLLDFTQAGSAHGVYEENELNGVYDQNWPEWYAAYLVENGLGELLGTPIAVERLSRLLKQYDQDYKRERPGMGWPQFYAERLSDQAQ